MDNYAIAMKQYAADKIAEIRRAATSTDYPPLAELLTAEANRRQLDFDEKYGEPTP